MSAAELILLFHIFVLGIPMLVLSVLLLFTTVEIRRFLNRYGEQGRLFTGILAVGYLFVFIAVVHELEHAFDWFGYDQASLAAETISHGVVLLVLVIVFYNFYQYRKAIRIEAKADRKRDQG